RGDRHDRRIRTPGRSTGRATRPGRPPVPGARHRDRLPAGGRRRLRDHGLRRVDGARPLADAARLRDQPAAQRGPPADRPARRAPVEQVGERPDLRLDPRDRLRCRVRLRADRRGRPGGQRPQHQRRGQRAARGERGRGPRDRAVARAPGDRSHDPGRPGGRMTDTPVDLTAGETGRVLRDVLGPLVAQGAIVRRPRATAWAERRQVDRTARRVLDGLRARYDGAPLVVRLGGRRMVLATRPEHVERILAGSPEPFTPASWEKRGALAHFQPDGVLVSPLAERAERRPYNEAVLDMSEPVHHDGEALVAVVERETSGLVAAVEASGRLEWDAFAATWWRLVRTVVLGRGARDDERLVALLDALRRDGNWSWFRPRRPWLRAALERRIA